MFVSDGKDSIFGRIATSFCKNRRDGSHIGVDPRFVIRFACSANFPFLNIYIWNLERAVNQLGETNSNWQFMLTLARWRSRTTRDVN